MKVEWEYPRAFRADTLAVVEKFLKETSKEFSMTRLEPILEALVPAGYFYKVEFSLEECASWPCISRLYFRSWAKKDWGTNSPTTHEAEMEFRWDTSSNHVVWIRGVYDHRAEPEGWTVLGDMPRGVGVFVLQLGDDDSECFYPCIAKIAKEAGFEAITKDEAYMIAGPIPEGGEEDEIRKD